MLDRLTNAIFYGLASTFYSARTGVERARNKSWAELHKSFGTMLGLIGDGKKTTQQQIDAYTSCIYLIAKIIYNRTSDVKWKLFVDRGREEKEQIFEHPVIDLLNKPNQFMTGTFLYQFTELQGLLTGKAFILELRNGVKLGGELWPLPVSQFVRFERGTTNKDFLTGYTFNTANGGQITYPVEDILYFQSPSPKDLLDGMGAVEAESVIIDIENYLERYERDFFKNSARPDILLTMKGEKIRGKQAQEASNRVLEEWRAKHQGPDKFHEPTILSNMDVTLLNASNKDFEFEALSDFACGMLFAAYSVPKGKLFPKDVNRANGFQIELTFNRDAVKPRLKLWDSTITNGLAHEYDLRLFIEHDNPVPVDVEFELKQDESDLKNLVNTVDEVRERRGLKKVHWGKDPWAPFNLVQISSTPRETEPESPEIPEEPEEEEPKTASGRIIKNQFLPTEEKRIVYWKQFDRRTRRQEAAFKKMTNELFREQEKEVLANLKKVGPKIEGFFNGWSKKKVDAYLKSDAEMIEEIIFESEPWIDKFRKRGRINIEAAYSESAEIVMADLGVDIAFDVHNTRADRQIVKQSQRFAKDVNVTTRKDLKRVLTEGFREGESVPKLAKRIRGVFDKAIERGEDIVNTGSRARTIARTEIIGASNGGSLEGMKQSKVVKKKEWLTAKDDRVRDAHEDMDGVTVGINELFAPGDGAVQYPQSINERCTVVASL